MVVQMTFSPSWQVATLSVKRFVAVAVVRSVTVTMSSRPSGAAAVGTPLSAPEVWSTDSQAKLLGFDLICHP
jgi:hypothetical protein